MNHKTRVAAAIKRQPVDRIPCAELVIADALIQTMFGQTELVFRHRLEFVQTLGLDAVCLHPVVADESSARLPAPQAVVFGELQDWTKSDLFTFAVLDGPMGWGFRLLGFEQLMTRMIRHHEDFLELTAAVEQLNMSLMDRLAASGINGIILADDIAFNQGVIARPSLLRQSLFPSLARQTAHAQQLGLPVFFHSDGNLALVLADIAAAGFDGLQCLETLAGMDIGAVKQQYGRKLCLWGNLDPAALIEPHSREFLEQAVRKIAAAAGRGSGFIFGTSSGLFAPMRLESIKSVYAIIRNL
ncbi:uroporphyrinogen decarboxylase family protein [Sporomusa termitida]|uniref:Uroporphyrinogen decarboxylase n=1 Tax=Sporomusa termitida TaxID=2377 RepID=A0A517DY60_9FIRM|nr:uroporphyrinogen decarboxylase family protein [Sporomusa termitida]QDR82282.1 Uroporphyrinogen decarboxylase [Sporomusa termitida]